MNERQPGAGRWDHASDVVIVGSGAGSFCGALVAHAHGASATIVEKQDRVGGSTAMSGGILWIPNHPLQAAAGVEDSYEMGKAYFDAVVGDAGPATSEGRVDAFLRTGPEMVRFLIDRGIPFRRCEGWPDYYDEAPGGVARGRAIEAELFDLHDLGDWAPRLQESPFVPKGLALRMEENASMLAVNRSWGGAVTVARIVARSARGRLQRKLLVNSGPALQGRLLRACLDRHVPLWTNAPVTDLIVEDGRVSGVEVERDGRRWRLRADQGVLVNSGGFAHNERMREKYQPQPASVAWTHSNPGDTGEMIETVMAHGAAVDLMDQAWWLPSAVMADGSLVYVHQERHKPHCMLVDAGGERFVDEGASYMEIGQAMYARHRDVPAVPSWLVMDANHRRKYLFGKMPPGYTPRSLIRDGFIRRAGSLDDLAAQCGIDATGLRRSVERFNRFATRGVDDDFHKGARAYDRYFGDPRQSPNPCLGTIERAPFYAVAVHPGDVGTSGGVLTDEHARVLREDGSVIAGLYATGNTTASVMGRCYPGAGASIGASFVFGYRAVQHALGGRG